MFFQIEVLRFIATRKNNKELIYINMNNKWDDESFIIK